MTMNNDELLMRLDGEVKGLKDDVKEVKSEMRHLSANIKAQNEIGSKVYRLLVGEDEAKQNAVLHRLEEVEKRVNRHDKIHWAFSIVGGLILFLPTLYGVIIAMQKLISLINHVGK